MRYFIYSAAMAASLLLSACGNSVPSDYALGPRADTAGLSACEAGYVEAKAKSLRFGPEVEAGLEYGKPGILFLSFDTLEEKDSAVVTVESLPGYSYQAGYTLRVFKNIPVLALSALPISEDLVITLSAHLRSSGLRGIYQDRPLEYHLDESAPFIGADRARTELGASGHGIGVAINDSGVDSGHGDFPNVGLNVKLMPPTNAQPPTFAGYFWMETELGDTSSGHGTHVAGTAVGDGARSGGRYVGMAPGATLLGVGAGDVRSIYFALEGFDFILDDARRLPYNIRTINNSWGGGNGGFQPYSPVSIATRRAHELGVIVVFAAGNAGPAKNTMSSHAASPCVISVAAGDKSGGLASFSSRGIPDDPDDHPDITAPGVSITATRNRLGGASGAVPSTESSPPFYTTLNGTSMAAPHITGIVALILEQNPDLTLDGVLEILTSTATPMKTGRKELQLWEVGAGYVNVYAAVQMAIDTSVRKQAKDVSDWSGTVDPSVCPPAAGCVVTPPFDEHEFTIAEPASGENLDMLVVSITWQPATDIDMEVVGPDGKSNFSGAGIGVNKEGLNLPHPKPGKYIVRTHGYTNGPQPYTGKVTLYRRVLR